jgi:hypothetical protein
VPAGPYFPNTNKMSLRAMGYQAFGAVDRIYEWVPVTGTSAPIVPPIPPVDDMFGRLLEVTLGGPQEVAQGSEFQHVATATNAGKLPLSGVKQKPRVTFLFTPIAFGLLSPFRLPPPALWLRASPY